MATQPFIGVAGVKATTTREFTNRTSKGDLILHRNSQALKQKNEQKYNPQNITTQNITKCNQEHKIILTMRG